MQGSAENSRWTRRGHRPSEVNSVVNRVGKETGVYKYSGLVLSTPGSLQHHHQGIFVEHSDMLDSETNQSPYSGYAFLLERTLFLLTSFPLVFLNAWVQSKTCSLIPFKTPVNWPDFWFGSRVCPCTSPYPCEQVTSSFPRYFPQYQSFCLRHQAFHTGRAWHFSFYFAFSHYLFLQTEEEIS